MGKVSARSWLGNAAQMALREMGSFEAAEAQAEAAWSSEQRAVCDQLFGRGFLMPGGEAEIVRLVRPLQFAGEARLLVIGAGVTGPAQALAAHLGVIPTGYERLAGQMPSAAEQDALSVAILPWQPQHDVLPHQHFHHGLLLTPLSSGTPEPVLASIVDSLRPAAQLVLIEYVATAAFDPTCDAAQAWMEREHLTAPPIDADDLGRVLARLGLHVRSVEDLSPLHVRLAVFDWRRLVGALDERPTATRGRVLLDEAETWALRAKLLDEGQIRLLRWHASLHAA